MDGPEDEQSCYAILGVDPAATSSEIRQAWAILSVGSPTAFSGFKLFLLRCTSHYISTYLTPKQSKTFDNCSQSFHFTFPPSLPSQHIPKLGWTGLPQVGLSQAP